MGLSAAVSVEFVTCPKSFISVMTFQLLADFSSLAAARSSLAMVR